MEADTSYWLPGNDNQSPTEVRNYRVLGEGYYTKNGSGYDNTKRTFYDGQAGYRHDDWCVFGNRWLKENMYPAVYFDAGCTQRVSSGPNCTGTVMFNGYFNEWSEWETQEGPWAPLKKQLCREADPGSILGKSSENVLGLRVIVYCRAGVRWSDSDSPNHYMGSGC